jgi:hypothetical protein
MTSIELTNVMKKNTISQYKLDHLNNYLSKKTKFFNPIINNGFVASLGTDKNTYKLKIVSPILTPTLEINTNYIEATTINTSQPAMSLEEAKKICPGYAEYWKYGAKVYGVNINGFYNLGDGPNNITKIGLYDTTGMLYLPDSQRCNIFNIFSGYGKNIKNAYNSRVSSSLYIPNLQTFFVFYSYQIINTFFAGYFVNPNFNYKTYTSMTDAQYAYLSTLGTHDRIITQNGLMTKTLCYYIDIWNIDDTNKTFMNASNTSVTISRQANSFNKMIDDGNTIKARVICNSDMTKTYYFGYAHNGGTSAANYKTLLLSTLSHAYYYIDGSPTVKYTSRVLYNDSIIH